MNLLELYEDVANLNEYLEQVLSQDDVNFDITFKNLSYGFQSVYLLEDKQEQDAKRKELIRALLHDHVSDIVDHITLHADEPWTPRNLIIDILSQHAYRPAEATLEIVSDEYEVDDESKKKDGVELNLSEQNRSKYINCESLIKEWSEGKLSEP